MRLFRTERALRAEFEREVMPHLDALYGAAVRLSRSPADAEDLVQDTLLKAFRFYDTFEPGGHLKAWLLRILTNTYITRYRRAVLERAAAEDDTAGPVGDGVLSRDAMRGLLSPVDEAERALLAREIERALSELSEEHRLVVVLSDMEDLSYKEIAETVGVPIGTVMSRLHRARKVLQGRLLDQAQALGIVAAGPVDAREPVDLAAFRKAKGGTR